MTRSLPEGLENDVNREVLNHIEGMSAHSDIADALQEAVQVLGDVQLFCPDWQKYRYVAASTQGVIFAVATGMNSIGFRLDERMRRRAVAGGAAPYSGLGYEWVAFTLFRDDWPQADLGFWARKAYGAAREVAAQNPRGRPHPGMNPAG